MISGQENLQSLAEKYPVLIPEFNKYGLGSYFKEDNLRKIGRFTRLNTLLKSQKIDTEAFIESMNVLIQTKEEAEVRVITDVQQQLHLMAMLPCGLRNPFKDFLEAHIVDNKKQYEGLNYLAEGNVNHELSYYPLLDSIGSAAELPDVIIASDVNNFFHKPFIDRFIKKGDFKTYQPYTPHPYLEKAGYSDPAGNYTMFTANMLVMAVDKNRLGDRKMPTKWEDILSEDFKDDIIMRGEGDFFCNAVLLPFFKDYGFNAVRALAANIRTGKHPAEMVKLAGSRKDEAATIYIMPYFFSKMIRNEQVEVVWPEDGAIASPVFMLVKSTAMEKHIPLLDFLLSEETGKMLVSRYFPSIHPEVDNGILPDRVKWLGWDFLSQNDIGQVKKDIQDVFMKDWNLKKTKS